MAKVAKSGAVKSKQANQLSIVHPHAAGIDIGDRIHAVAVPPEACDDPVRVFGTMTCDMKAICQWLKECKVNTVAMESTGVYWKPLYMYLSEQGIYVNLVNARNIKNVSGRKTDESDAAWLQKLHSFGLLSSSYLPSEEQEALRELVRFRKTLVSDAACWVQRMQKSLELMNVKLHTVISDIVGKTGSAIVEAIIAGERDAAKFLPLVNSRIKADEQTIVKSLEGNWRQEYIFTLEQSYQQYRYCLSGIERCDRKIEEQLGRYEALRNEGEIEPKGGRQDRKIKNAPHFNTRSYLRRILKVDVLAIYGLGESGGLQILAETGTDMTKWPTEKHFVSWLNLCPNNKISGGKTISSHLARKGPSIAGQAFRQAANAVQKSDHWLADYFRRMKAKNGNKYAIVATANKLATIYYKMVRYQVEFQPVPIEHYINQRKEQKIKHLERKLEKLKATSPN